MSNEEYKLKAHLLPVAWVDRDPEFNTPSVDRVKKELHRLTDHLINHCVHNGPGTHALPEFTITIDFRNALDPWLVIAEGTATRKVDPAEELTHSVLSTGKGTINLGGLDVTFDYTGGEQQ